MQRVDEHFLSILRNYQSYLPIRLANVQGGYSNGRLQLFVGTSPMSTFFPYSEATREDFVAPINSSGECTGQILERPIVAICWKQPAERACSFHTQKLLRKALSHPSICLMDMEGRPVLGPCWKQLGEQVLPTLRNLCPVISAFKLNDIHDSFTRYCLLDGAKALPTMLVWTANDAKSDLHT